MKREGFYLSCDHKTKIHAVAWIPENREIRAVIQLCHGMTEYVNRYDEFARWLAEKGYYVTGHDHRGAWAICSIRGGLWILSGETRQ